MISYYFESTLRYSPVLAGVAFLPLVAGMLVSANLSTSVIVPRFGVRLAITSGMALCTLGMVLRPSSGLGRC